MVTTCNRSSLLEPLVASLAAQTYPSGRFEVIVVDDGSSDDTWDVLRAIVGRTSLPFAAVRQAANHGPGAGRNAGVRQSRAPLIAFTDDDCLPTPGWLRALVAGFDEGIDLVQGRVEPDPSTGAGRGPWSHTVTVGGLTPWAETANVAYRKAAFERVNGFDEVDAADTHRGEGQRIGEDAVLAWKVVGRRQRRRFASEALVHHRVVPATYAQRARHWRNLMVFPWLARASGLVDDSLLWGVFLNEQTATFDLAAGSVAVAVVARRPLLVLGALPWARQRLPALSRNDPSPPVLGLRLVQQFGLELVGLASLLEGSVRHRKLVL